MCQIQNYQQSMHLKFKKSKLNQIFFDTVLGHAEITSYKKDASFFLSPHLSLVWPWIGQSRGTGALCHEDPKAGKETFEQDK